MSSCNIYSSQPPNKLTKSYHLVTGIECLFLTAHAPCVNGGRYKFHGATCKLHCKLIKHIEQLSQILTDANIFDGVQRGKGWVVQMSAKEKRKKGH